MSLLGKLKKYVVADFQNSTQKNHKVGRNFLYKEKLHQGIVQKLFCYFKKLDRLILVPDIKDIKWVNDKS